MGTPGGGVAHRGRLLEGDADAAARGVFDGLLGLVAQVVALQAVTGRSQGAEMGAGARATHPTGGGDRGPRGARWRAASRGWGEGEGCVCVRLRARAGRFCRAKQGMCSESERVRFLARVGVCKRREEKCSLLCQRALTERRTLGGGALERGHGAPLENLAQLGDTLSGIGAIAIPAEAAELVPLQTAQVGSGSVNGH